MTRRSKYLALLATLVASASAVAQDPIPVAPVGYWQHQHRPHWGPPAYNAFTPPPVPYYYYGPQLSTAPYGQPEAGVSTPFFIPSCAPYCGHQHCRKGQGFAGLFGSHGPPTIDSLPTHPYARSPRDFFMFHENLEAERSRDLRPTLIP